MDAQSGIYTLESTVDERDGKGGLKSASVFVLERGQKVARYQVRVKPGGRPDVYYSAISNGSFSGPKKLACAPTADGADPAVATIAQDLGMRGTPVPTLSAPGASLADLVG